MKKHWLIGLSALSLLILLGSCSVFGPPDYVGTWNATVGTTPVVLVLEKSAFTLTVGEAATEVILSGDLSRSGTTLTLETTGATMAGTALTPEELAALFAQGNITASEAVEYAVANDTLTASGTLITTITGGATSLEFTKAAT